MTGSASSVPVFTSLAKLLGVTGGPAATGMGEGTGTVAGTSPFSTVTVGPLAVSEGDPLSPNQSSMWTLAFLFTIPRVPNVDGRVPTLNQSSMMLMSFVGIMKLGGVYALA